MPRDKIITVLFYGIGGQGVLSASEVCAKAAAADGYHVKKSEVKGMAQRGGSVEAYVRFGARVFSPLPERGRVDILACLHESEHERLSFELKKGGRDMLSYLKSARAAVGGKVMFINTYMLGVVSAFLPVRESSWIMAMKLTFKRALEENARCFARGRDDGMKCHDL